jgi:repressor LexA
MHKHVQALVEAGLVEPMDGKQRGVRLQEPMGHGLPLLGYIAAGQPIEAIENLEEVHVPPHLRTDKPCYVLQVKGDSMIDDGILNGDWVVVEQRDYARNGEIVVALIDGEEATLKRINQRPGEVLLVPANSSMAPMVYSREQVQIRGVVVGQMRSYRD